MRKMRKMEEKKKGEIIVGGKMKEAGGRGKQESNLVNQLGSLWRKLTLEQAGRDRPAL